MTIKRELSDARLEIAALRIVLAECVEFIRQTLPRSERAAAAAMRNANAVLTTHKVQS